MKKGIINGRIVLEDSVIDNGFVLFEKGTILSYGRMDDMPSLDNTELIDVEGCIVGPGFVDVHCHGGGGEWSIGNVGTVANTHLAYGTTSLLITFAYSDEINVILNGINKTLAFMSRRKHTNIAGIHMEGPYINRKYGAQSKKGKDINAEEYTSILQAGKGAILLWTLAPELTGIEPLIDELEKSGIVISVGHSEAEPKRVLELIRRGLKNSCHTTNAMPVLTFKKDGTHKPETGMAVLLDERIYAEIIPDKCGVHVHPLTIRLIEKMKGPDRIIIITDASAYAGVPSDYPLEPATVLKDGVRYYLDELAGSYMTMDKAAKNYQTHTGCSLIDLFKATSLNPARMLGIDSQVGSISPGKMANLVVAEEDIRISHVVLHGKIMTQPISEKIYL